MEKKYTSSPWEVSMPTVNNTDCIATIYQTQQFEDGESGSTLICDISRSPGDEIARNNAIIIAKAPEMYELLIYLQKRGGLGLDIHTKIANIISKIEN